MATMIYILRWALRVSFVIGLGAALSCYVTAGAEVPAVAPTPSKGQEVELQGRVVCLPERMHELYDTELEPDHQHVYGFQTTDGRLFLLLRTKYSEALFVDERVRAKELRLKGRVLPKSQILEVTGTRSVRNGKVFDLYYYCSVCSIETVSPGPCACCRGPVELTERPLKERRDALESGTPKH